MSKPHGAPRVSRRIGAIAESATLAVDAKAKALQAAGEDVIGFGAGEPDFPTPAHIVDAAVAACRRPDEPPVHADAGPARAAGRDRGQDRARLRLRRRGERRCSSPTAASTRSTTRSRRCSTPATRCSCPRRTGPPTPRRSSSPTACRSCCPPPRPADFRVTVEQLEAARTPRTKALLFVSPSNPTGAVYPRDEVEAIGRWAVEHGIWVRHRRDLRAPHLRRPRSSRRCRRVVPELADTCVVLNGVAKTYAMTGWRVGWMIGPRRRHHGRHQPAVALDVERRQRCAAGRARRASPATSTRSRRCAPRSTRRGQDDARAARGDPGRHVPGAAGRVLLLPVVRGRARPRDPGGTPAHDTLELCELLLEEAKVAIVPGEAFGAPGYAAALVRVGDDDLVRGRRAHRHAARLS